MFTKLLVPRLIFSFNFFFLLQICDFGLAKWLPENWTHHNVSKFEGTFGFVTFKLIITVLSEIVKFCGFPLVLNIN